MQDFESLEAHYDTIKEEYKSIEDKMGNYPEIELYSNGGWKVFPIFDWPSGKVIDAAAKFVPETRKLIEKYVPNHGAAAFSKLRSNTIIRPHFGHQGDFLRYHLGIDIHPGNCGLKCDKKVYRWKNGVSFIFDDRKEHSAWNKSRFDRVILIIDFKE